MLGRFPYEIFREIIRFSTTHHLSLTSSFQFDEINLPPINATHVCHSWRIALLSDPTMWTCIMLSCRTKFYLHQLVEILSRSCSAPLNVLIDLDQNKIVADPLNKLELRDMLTCVSRQMPRCRQLLVSIPKEFASLVQSLSKPAPMLRKFYLEVKVRESWSDLDQGRSDTLGKIHDALFSGHAPNLEHVHLQVSRGLKDLHLSLLKDLTNLHLYFEFDAHIDCDIMLDILRSSPSLRVLDISLHGLDQTEIALSKPSNYRIPLPRLQELKLHTVSRVDILNLLLEHLDFPINSVNFDITCGISRSEIPDSSSLACFLEQQSFTCLSIFPSRYQTSVEFSERMDKAPAQAGSEFKIISYPPGVFTKNPSIFLRLINPLNITHLSLSDPIPKSATLRSIFVALANLQSFCVSHVFEDGGDDDPSLGFLMSTSYFKALMLRSSRRSNLHGRAGAVSNEVTNLVTSLELDETATAIRAPLTLGLPCPSLRMFEIRLSFYKYSTTLDEAYLRALEWCYRVREQAGCQIQFIVILISGGVGLVEGIDEWLHTHEGFPMEVRNEIKLRNQRTVFCKLIFHR